MATAAEPLPAPGEVRAYSTGAAQASPDVRAITGWIAASEDNQRLPFIIVDKIHATLFLFDADGLLRSTTPVLLGAGRGDESPPGIGEKKLSAMTAAERITPAGRFVAQSGENLSGRDILWIDYAAAISLHRATDVKPGLSRDGRLKRLASSSLAGRRVSHGCVNVSGQFYDEFIRTTFRATPGIVYILPDTRSLAEVFPKAAVWRRFPAISRKDPIG